MCDIKYAKINIKYKEKLPFLKKMITISDIFSNFNN